MAQLKQLTKRNVIILESGLDLGRPDDVIVDPVKHRAVAIVLHNGSVPELSTVCSAAKVRSFATDALTVTDLESMHLAYTDEEVLELLRSGIRLRGRTALSKEGANLGTIAGADLDENGNVIEYRVKSGLLGLFGITKSLPVSELKEAGEHVAIVR